MTVILDERYPDLADHVSVDVRGGAGGDPGGGAIGGRSPLQSTHVFRGRASAGARAPQPANGEWPGLAAHGQNGQGGMRGADGTASFIRGDVRGAFGPLETIANR